MKKLSLIFGLILSISLITSCDTEETELTEEKQIETYAKSSGFDPKTIFDEVINDTTNVDGIKVYDELSDQQKTNVFVYKYQQFKSDNVLNANQKSSIDDLIAYYSNNFRIEEDIKVQPEIDAVFENFSVFQSVSLIGFVGNNPVDPEPETVTDEHYTGFTYQLKSSCHEEFVDGESIGFYETITVRRYRDGYLKETWKNTLQPCGNYALLTAS
ncbi:MAG: hypothetical protein WBG46_02960 [Nonlabens sp.]